MRSTRATTKRQRRPAALAAQALALLGASALAGCGEHEGGSLIIEVPARVRQAATSDDAELCGKLAVDITFDHRADGAPPLLENEPLVPVPGDPCTFTLPSTLEKSFPRGEYDVLVRFLAGPNAFVGSESCAAQGVGEVWVGAYVVEGLKFPEQALRLPEDTFLSRPGDAGRVPVPGVSFDLDGDGRDNLAEVAAGSDPCVKNAPPVVELTVEPNAIDEEQPVTLRVSSTDPAGARHRVTVRIRHEHGPTVGTELITYRRHTSSPANASLTPDPSNGTLSERWSFAVEEATENGAGALSMTLRFVPDEPFVGRLHITATADDGSGTILSEAPPAVLDVTDLDDPTELLFEDEEGALVPVARVDFREVGPGVEPTVRRFRISDADLDADVSQWTVTLAEGSPEGMALTKDLSFWRLRWAPENEHVLSAPAEGYTLYLQFRDPTGAPVGEPQAYPVGIAPLYNDAPSLGDMTDLDLSLPAGPFVSKILHFDFYDPDEATGQPTCTLTLEPTNGTECESAWSETRCEVNGPREGDRWPFLITLAPSESYEACGSSPQFRLGIEVADVPPPGAEPATPKTASTALILYTAEAVSVLTVTGGAVAAGAFYGPTEVSIDGARGVGAFMASEEGSGARTIYLVDLDASPPTFLREIPRTELCEIYYDGGWRTPHAVAIDEVNGRLVGFGRKSNTDSSCSGPLVVFSISTEPPYEVLTWPKGEACDGACSFASCGGTPSVDIEGNAYLPCGGDTGTLLRIDGDNQLSTHHLDEYDGVQDPAGVAVVEAPDGKSWFVWPDKDGILFADLGTWDEPELETARLTLPAWQNHWLLQGRFDPWRRNYLYAYDDGGDGVDLALYRVSFDTGAPVQGAPLVLGNHGSSSHGDVWVRFVLKPVAPGQPEEEADLVITGQSIDGNRVHVDLDSFTRLENREASDYYYVDEVFESPDPRFYIGWMYTDSPGYEGIKLYPWDPTLPFDVQLIPGIRHWSLASMRYWATSHRAGIVTFSDQSGTIRVLRFLGAP